MPWSKDFWNSPAGLAAREKGKATRAENAAARKRGELTDVATPGKDKSPRRAAGAQGGGRPSRSATLEAQVVGLLTMANGAIMLAAPEDALTPQEIKPLAAALAADPWTRPHLQRAAGKAIHAPLVFACVAIAIPRLARHGVIPPELAGALTDGATNGASVEPGELYAVPDEQPANEPWSEPGYSPGVPLAPGGTHGGDWRDGDGQDNAGRVPVGSASEFDRA